jgi:hypothetical protein
MRAIAANVASGSVVVTLDPGNSCRHRIPATVAIG